MKVIRPIAITDSNLTDSNVAETDYAAWDVGTTYALGDRVIRTSTHKVYESVQASNTGHNPVTDTTATWWIEVSATNRWKAFDSKLADLVENTDSITYEVTIDQLITGVAFFNLRAVSVQIQVVNGSAVTTYDETSYISATAEVTDWFSYFFGSLDADTELIFAGIPGYVGHVMTITITAASSTDAAVGQIVMGEVIGLGDTLEGTKIGITDYSRKERDAYGNAIIVERDFSRDAEFQFAMEATDAKRVLRLLADLRATAAVYFADEEIVEYGATIFGYPSDVQIPLVHRGKSIVQLEVKGLV